MDLERPTDRIRAETEQSLRNQAAHMELEPRDVSAYVASTPRERQLIKMRAHKKLKKRAREAGLDPEEFVDWTPERRALEELGHRHGAAKSKVAEADLDDPDELDKEDTSTPIRVYSEGMNVPPDDPRPINRDGMTIGAIVELEQPPDLVGDAQPINLADLYARWPIGRPGGEDFYIRVERLQPKKYQEVTCAGFLTQIRRPVNEDQFCRWFGGREYHLTLYGPDPRGRLDANGDIIIKRLTQPIHVTVPHVPPNLDVMPAVGPPPETKTTMNLQDNPFATVFSRAPMTSADAAMHTSSMKFVESVFRNQAEELKEVRRNPPNGNDPTKLLGFVGEMTRAQVEALKQDAEKREQLLREQLLEERQERKEQERELQEMKQQMQQVGLSRSGDSIEMLKFGDQAAQRQSEYYRQQLENAQRSHDEQIKMLRHAHDEELKRERDRFRDLEEHFKRIAEEDRRAANEREKSLKEEVDRIRREERDNADRRVSEVEKAAQRRYEDLESAHNRELRSIKDNMEVRFTSEKNRLEFELSSMRDRMEETKAEMSRVRDESDPIQIIERRKTELKALGFVEKDADAPTSVWERFAQAAGGGVGQLLANADIGALTAALVGRQGAAPPGRPTPGPGSLPSGGVPRQLPAAAVMQQQRRRGEVWASQGAPIGVGGQVVSQQQQHRPKMTPEEAAEAAERAARGEPTPAQKPEQTAQVPDREQTTAPPPSDPSPPSNVRMPPSKFHSVFNDQEIVGFLQNVEGAINSGFPPEQFANIFATRFPQQATRVAQEFSHEDAIEYVKLVAYENPVAKGSPILRRDGAKWLSKLWTALQSAENTGTAGTGQ